MARMARGWESKSVEEQINDRQAASEIRTKKETLTRAEVERQGKRDGLLLARAHTLNALQSSRDERYRLHLQRALAHLDSELAKLDRTPHLPG